MEFFIFTNTDKFAFYFSVCYTVFIYFHIQKGVKSMKKEGYYSSGEFARMAHVTLRTIRYYDKQNILKPSYVSDAGARFYTDEDLARLQQILLLKFLGFSLDDIPGYDDQ